MTTRKVFRCMVDDTVLITNITEIKKWVLNGSITLIVPVYTLDRLALLKQDVSQIGANARQSVEFLDRVTEGRDGLPPSAISLQGPTQQYQTWSEVENCIVAEDDEAEQEADKIIPLVTEEHHNVPTVGAASSSQPGSGTTNVLSQMLLSKLNFAKQAEVTPPTSPSSSNDRSAKTSPEVTVNKPVQNSVIVPHSLTPLVNAVVWQANNPENLDTTKPVPELYFISNSADAASVVRKFGVRTKNVHQLRQAVTLEDQELKNRSKYLQKHPGPSDAAAAMSNAEPKAIFKYQEDSDDEQVVFKPRSLASGPARSSSGSPILYGSSANSRPSSGHLHSPRLAHSHPNRAQLVRPEIPTEEIDPDSFDRGNFGRTSGQRLAISDGNHAVGSQRVPSQRGTAHSPGPPRGFQRGSSRGFDRGSMRGRGRLFVP